MKANAFLQHFFVKTQILIFSLIAAIFTSCSDIASGEVYEKVDAIRYVYITLDSDKSALSINPARTITADAIDFTDSTVQDYYFYIWGKSSSGSVAPKKVNFMASSGTTGTIELDFPVTSYAFTLAVTESEPSELTSSAITEKAILIGYTQADLTYSKNIKFNLSTNGLRSVGKVYLNFYLDEDTWTNEQVANLSANYTVKVGFFNEDGSARTGEWGLYSLNKETPVSTSNWFGSVNPGTYEIRVTFSEQGGEYLVCYYTDKIVVAPNRTITSDVYLPNVLLDLPAAPSEFKAAYCMDYRFYSLYNTESDTVTKLTSNDQIEENNFNTYGILLSWTDNSNNETGFKVTLADISKINNGVLTAPHLVEYLNSQSMTNSVWNEIVEPYIGQTDIVKIFTPRTYSSSADYILGSVEKNKTSMIVWGTFGSCYIAKIEAMNPAGLSEPCYVTVNEDFNIGVYDTNYANNTAVYTGNAFATSSNPCKIMNRYKIMYQLAGGKITYTHGPNSVISNKSYLVTYHTYGDGTINCYIASDTSTGTIDNPALIYYGSDTTLLGKRWNRWQYSSYGGIDLVDILGGTTVTIDSTYSYQKTNDYTGYTSLYLFARYD